MEYILFHVIQKKMATFREPVRLRAHYPSHWVRGPKPPISIFIRHNSLETLRPIIKGQVNDRMLDLDLVKEYIYCWGEQVLTKCNEDWKSYGTTIAKAGEEVDPWSVLRVELNPGYPEMSNTMLAAGIADFEVIVILVGLYGILREQNESQKKQIATKIETQTRVKGVSAILMSLAPQCGPWLYDKDYIKMIAALDMFFFMFKSHKYSSLRAGTFLSRHRNCGGCTLIGDTIKLLQTNKAGLLEWIFCESIAKEVNILTSTEQETEVQNSYFPYQIDMGLVTNSAYTTSRNPCFFVFAHIVGALLGSERSVNARMLAVNIMDISANAKVVAFVFAQKQGMIAKQGSVGGAGASQSADIDGAPKTQDAAEWRRFMQKREWKLTPPMNRFIETAKSRIVNPGKGTIGEYIKQQF